MYQRAWHGAARASPIPRRQQSRHRYVDELHDNQAHETRRHKASRHQILVQRRRHGFRMRRHRQSTCGHNDEDINNVSIQAS